MDDSSRAVVDVLSALGEARYALKKFAADTWARGTYVYVLGHRGGSSHEWVLDSDRRATGYGCSEIIGLPDDRELVISLTVWFRGDGFSVQGVIETSWEIPGGYQSDVLLDLPSAAADTSSELIDLLRSYVDRICQRSTLLDELDLPRKTKS